jgi:hypothetical protein
VVKAQRVFHPSHVVVDLYAVQVGCALGVGIGVCWSVVVVPLQHALAEQVEVAHDVVVVVAPPLAAVARGSAPAPLLVLCELLLEDRRALAPARACARRVRVRARVLAATLFEHPQVLLHALNVDLAGLAES